MPGRYWKVQRGAGRQRRHRPLYRPLRPSPGIARFGRDLNVTSFESIQTRDARRDAQGRTAAPTIATSAGTRAVGRPGGAVCWLSGGGRRANAGRPDPRSVRAGRGGLAGRKAGGSIRDCLG